MRDGCLVPGRDEAVCAADVVITVTGARSVVTAADEPLLKDGAIVANAGRLPWEVEGIESGRVTLLEGAVARGEVGTGADRSAAWLAPVLRWIDEAVASQFVATAYAARRICSSSATSGSLKVSTASVFVTTLSPASIIAIWSGVTGAPGTSCASCAPIRASEDGTCTRRRRLPSTFAIVR